MKPEQTWYDGRALAESARTLAWRYAVGAAPFARNVNLNADDNYLYQLGQLLRDAPNVTIEPSTRPAISTTMREIRGADLKERRDIYIERRIADQQQWYTRKAKWNSHRALYWKTALLTAEVVGVVTILLRAADIIAIDLVGVVATAVGTGAAWLAVKQHDSLSRAYAFAANELGIVRGRLELIDDEEPWAGEAADAEEAISREHTMWRASRSTIRSVPPR